MALKKTSDTASAKKSSGSATAHASYQDMIKEAILNLKERNGSSRQAIKKYIQVNNNLGTTTEAAFSNHLSKALNAGEKNGVFSRPKGPSGPVKLAKRDATKPAPKVTPAATTKSAPKTASKTGTAKTSSKRSTEVKAAPKKSSTTKSTASTTTKATTAKPKANASRPRKTAPSAPAVVHTPAVVLGKTKSGRVTKSTAPSAKARAAPVKRTTAKKAAPKKSKADPSPKKSDAAAS